MTTHRASTYTESIETFLEGADWLTDVDTPAVTTLLLLARRLDDEGFHAQTIAQFGLCYRALLKRAPGGDEEEDALDALLNGKKKTGNPNATRGNSETHTTKNEEKNNPGGVACDLSDECRATCPWRSCTGKDRA